MQHWPLSPPPMAAAASAIVGRIGAPDFASSALRVLNDGGLRAGSWSVYRVWRERPPVMYLSASLGVPDTTQDCFRAYLGGLYRADRSFDTVAAPGASALLRMQADEAPSEGHREAIYRRHHMLERLSLVQRQGDGSVLALNLYRHEHQGRFGAGEVDGLADLAPLLLASVQRHMELSEPVTEPLLRDQLRARCGALTERELDVCERLLRGWSYDGIAADLELSVATVKTYRARAFARLGMHFKSELFAAFSAFSAATAKPCPPLG